MIEEIEWYNTTFYNNKTIKFGFKDIFNNHWDNFLTDTPDLNIMPIVLKDFDIEPLTCFNCGNQMKWQYRVC